MSGRWNVSVNYERIDVTSSYPSVDPNWTATDPNGHDHYYDHGYPTLEYVVDRSHWCYGHEGAFDHDPHEQVDESHYECTICREVVDPGILPAFTPQSVPGDITMTITGRTDDGRQVTVEPCGDAAGRLMDRLQLTSDRSVHDDIIGGFVDDHPEFVTETVWSS